MTAAQRWCDSGLTRRDGAALRPSRFWTESPLRVVARDAYSVSNRASCRGATLLWCTVAQNADGSPCDKEDRQEEITAATGQGNRAWEIRLELQAIGRHIMLGKIRFRSDQC